jgi:hypothetical protein
MPDRRWNRADFETVAPSHEASEEELAPRFPKRPRSDIRHLRAFHPSQSQAARTELGYYWRPQRPSPPDASVDGLPANPGFRTVISDGRGIVRSSTRSPMRSRIILTLIALSTLACSTTPAGTQCADAGGRCQIGFCSGTEGAPDTQDCNAGESGIGPGSGGCGIPCPSGTMPADGGGVTGCQ